MLSQNKAQRVVRILKAVSHPIRLQIVNMLCADECDVSGMAQALGVKQSLVSQHLAQLRLTDLVKAERSGNRAIYSLKEPLLRDLVSCFDKCTER